jgi:diguanylate cyclase (GGDEF)-like protein/PAS domain S-box-containing protein
MNGLKRLLLPLHRHAHLYQMIAAGVAAAAMVLMFFLTEPEDLRAQNALQTQFNTLQRDEAELGEAVLELDFSLSNDYDRVNALLAQMLGVVLQLQDDSVNRSLKHWPKFASELRLLAEHLLVQQDVLERFKSRNAVLKSSLIYLPKARDDVLADLPTGTPLRGDVNLLVEKVLLNRIRGAGLAPEDLTALIQRVEAGRAALPANARAQLSVFLRHVRVVDGFERDMPALVVELTSRNSVGPLMNAYRQYDDEQQHRASWFRAFLLFATLGFMLYALRALFRMQDQSAGLMLAAGVFTHAREGILITDGKAHILDVNEAFTRITGYTREDVLHKNPRLLNSGRHDPAFFTAMWRALTEEGHWFGEIWNRRKSGEVYAEMQTISAVRDPFGHTSHYVALFSDITALKEHEQRLQQLAHFDALTGLPNRLLLADRMHQAMSLAQRRAERLAVAYLDLDGFKAVNDQHGHEAGDHLLMTLASRMKAVLRDCDTLARLGGDEFVVVMQGPGDALAAREMVNRLLAVAAEPVLMNQARLQVSVSMGMTFYPQAEDVDADQLLRQADRAMYQAKLSGKNRCHVFDADQDRSARGQYQSIDRIRQALSDGELVLHYQPKVRMRSGVVVGVEALMRWQHPDLGLLSPSEFLPVIETNRLALDVVGWALNTALAQTVAWRTCGLELNISVNVGAHQLQEPDFAERLGQILASYPEVRPSCLSLEVLESSALQDLSRVSRAIETCKALGVEFALDDFGTGYASLSYLKRLPVAQLKIDQSFVSGLLHEPDDRAILVSVLGLAKAFGLEVVAEGVESVAHGVMLLELGCELGQGYGIAHPMPGEQLPDWITQWRPDAAWLSAGMNVS